MFDIYTFKVKHTEVLNAIFPKELLKSALTSVAAKFYKIVLKSVENVKFKIV